MKSKKLEYVAIALAVVASVFTAPVAFGQTKPAVELEAAINKEQVDGDLKTAIAAYQKIGANGAAPRDVRAKALLHLGGCYEKLGRQAQSVYEQIARDFGDQTAATQANARLAVLRQGDRVGVVPATMTQRKIEFPVSNPNGLDGLVYTDGQRAINRDDVVGALMVSNLVGMDKRVLLKPKSGRLTNLWPSRDFSTVVTTLIRPDGSQTFAVIRTDGTGYREIRGDESCRPDWSWDNVTFSFARNTSF